MHVGLEYVWGPPPLFGPKNRQPAPECVFKNNPFLDFCGLSFLTQSDFNETALKYSPTKSGSLSRRSGSSDPVEENVKIALFTQFTLVAGAGPLIR